MAWFLECDSMIEMIEKQRKQMYAQMDNLIAKKQKRKQEWFTKNVKLIWVSGFKFRGCKILNWFKFWTDFYFLTAN